MPPSPPTSKTRCRPLAFQRVYGCQRLRLQAGAGHVLLADHAKSAVHVLGHPRRFSKHNLPYLPGCLKSAS
jgi:hypothetical protein